MLNMPRLMIDDIADSDSCGVIQRVRHLCHPFLHDRPCVTLTHNTSRIGQQESRETSCVGSGEEPCVRNNTDLKDPDDHSSLTPESPTHSPTDYVHVRSYSTFGNLMATVWPQSCSRQGLMRLLRTDNSNPNTRGGIGSGSRTRCVDASSPPSFKNFHITLCVLHSPLSSKP